jgi:hypothetical protein
VFGIGPLSRVALVRSDSSLVIASPSGVDTLPLPPAPDAVRSIVMVRVPYWPVAWLGWGPAWVCDLRFDDAQGRAMHTVPAGGGWVETARRAMRYGLYFGPETQRRLIPGWSRVEITGLAGAMGVEVATARLRRRFRDRILPPVWTDDPDWLASTGPSLRRRA